MAFGVAIVTFLCVTLVVTELVTNLLWRVWRMASTTRIPFVEGVLGGCSLLLAAETEGSLLFDDGNLVSEIADVLRLSCLEPIPLTHVAPVFNR